MSYRQTFKRKGDVVYLLVSVLSMMSKFAKPITMAMTTAAIMIKSVDVKAAGAAGAAVTAIDVSAKDG